MFASAFQGHRHPAFRGGAPGGCGRKRPAKAVRGGAGRPCLRLHSGVSSPGIHGRRAGRLRPKNAPRRLFAGARGRPCLRLHFGGHYRPAFMGGAPGGCGRKNALRRLFAGAREGRVCVCISGGIIAQHSGAARRAVAAEKRPAKAVRGGAGRPCLRLHFGSIIAQHSGAARRAVAAEKRPAKVVRGGAGRPCLRLHFGSIIARHSGAARRAAPAEKNAPRRLFAGYFGVGKAVFASAFQGHRHPAFRGGAPGGSGRKTPREGCSRGRGEGRVCVCISGGIIAQHSGAARRAVAAEKRPAKAVRGVFWRREGRVCVCISGGIIAQHSGAARRAVAAEKTPREGCSRGVLA